MVKKLTRFLENQGFRFSISGLSLLIFHHNNIQIFLLIYVDDLLFTGNDEPTIRSLLTALQSHFALKQLGQISLFLGIHVLKQSTGLFLTQQHYAKKLLLDSGFTDCKPASTPITPKSKQKSLANQPFHDPTLYRRLAGSLQYLSITRPDIAFATNQIYQHMHQSTVDDFQALKRLLRYVKGTDSYGLPIQTGALTLRTYKDADWASDAIDRKSILRLCTCLGSTLVS
ncbi:hypothetical protein KFK09_004299 [Dendrobium nobile]|uniref:Reverse transcriptase Ty1/copia-type domain-containing protein n=1 Tax=Dendrobium nobile TaxID=94219 RepID=A0A8T3C074_DENNO|nr:hypothetical protein KFK09_004299 [Dendrobium nobile]